MSGLAGTLRGGDEAGAHPVGDALPRPFGGVGDQGVLLAGEANAAQFGARIVEGRSAGSHAMRIAATESIDNRYFRGHDKYMTTTGAREALTAAIAARTAAILTAQTMTGRQAAAAWRTVEDLDSAVGSAAADVERAVRAENPNADEATIQTAARSTA